MNRLSLGPIPKVELVRLAITVPVPLKADLDRYAQLHEQTWGEKTDAAALIPHIVGAFLARDREFQRALKNSKEFTSGEGKNG
jgi:hypothetical protein